MSILSFGKFSSEKPRRVDPDWSNQEMADFFRAHRLLVESGASIGMDRGLSDEADPWLVFFDAATHEVFLHIARIDGMCLLVCDHLSIKIRAARIDQLINKFEEAIRTSFSLRAERSSNVVTHPASRIIMSISAVFLLFKLDSTNAALAREDIGGGSADPQLRKELSLPVRAQAALARIFEGAENPVAVAAIASVILASDLLSGDAHAPEYSQAPELLLFEVEQQAASKLLPSPEGTIQIAQNNEDVTVLSAATTGPTSVDLPLLVEAVGGHVEVVLDATESRLGHAEQVVFQFAAMWDGQKAPQVEAPSAPIVVTPAVAAEPAPAPEPEKPAATPAPLSIKVFGQLAEFDWTGFTRADLVGGIVADDGELSLATALAPEPELAAVYGFAADTALSGDQLMTVLRHMITGLGRFELEEQGTVLRVEQLDIDHGNPELLGIWNNTMSDGSSISLVGQIDLLDDIAGFLPAAQLVA
jgi:hypothetical protein